SYRWETLAPTPDELIDADRFFLKYPPKHLWSEAKFKKIDFGDVPEVAFLGRSNVGKSSLLNALLNNKNLAYTSSKPGRTRLMNAFGIADGKLVLLDMPGYGHASREEWGVQIMKYLKSRKQFRRAFLLIDAKHGLKKNDLQLLEQFGQEGISYQIVLSKIDRVKPEDLEKLFKEVRDLMENGIPGANAGLGEILATAGDPAKKGEKKVGLSDLRRAILVASGLE
ncbi:P-loop containing nucleoside triphosphate hydrolase protein, partial [Morchella snyderi]